MKIPFFNIARQWTTVGEEVLHVTDQIARTGVVMNGCYTDAFEHWLTKQSYTSYAVTVGSGTQALEAIATYIYEYKDMWQLGPSVTLPALTYVATANAFKRAGFSIVFADVDQYGIIKTDDLKQTQVLCPVGLFGAVPAESLYHTTQISCTDGAQHWLAPNAHRNWGVGVAVSFDPTKNLSNSGMGGAVLSDDPQLRDFVKAWRSNQSPLSGVAGTNSRMSEIDCATLMIKSRYLPQWQNRRHAIARRWVDQFSNLPHMRTLVDDTNIGRHSFHKFVIATEHRDQLAAHLNANGIDTRVHYQQPLHEREEYAHCRGPGSLSNASALARQVISLPIYPELTDNEVEYIADQVSAFFLRLK